MYQVSFNSLLYFQRYAPDTLFIAKMKKESDSVNTGYRITILTFCISSDGPLSMFQISFNPLLYLQRYAPDKIFIAKIIKGSNSVNTSDRLWFLHCASLLMALHQCIKYC